MYVVVRVKDCFLAYDQVTMSVPVLLLAIFIWFGLVLSAHTGNTFAMLRVQLILQTITTILYMNYVTVSIRQEIKTYKFNFAICH